MRLTLRQINSYGNLLVAQGNYAKSRCWHKQANDMIRDGKATVSMEPPPDDPEFCIRIRDAEMELRKLQNRDACVVSRED